MKMLVRRSLMQVIGAVVIALTTASASAQLPVPQTTQKADTPSPLEPIAWMTGSWAAEAKQPGSAKASRILTRFTPQLDGRVMSMETTFDGQLVYQGITAYDPAKKAIALWYLTPNGESIRGTVVPKTADEHLYDFTMTLTNGIELHFQTLVHRVDADHYKWSLFTTINKGATWDKLFEVEYHRLP